MEFSIRTAEEADYPQLPGIESAADSVMGMPGLPAASSAEEYRAGLHVLIAERAGQLLGLAKLDEVDGQAHLEQISVLPEAAGQGIGRALIEAAKNWARTAGYRRMTLCTFRDVPFNAPFYARCGFRVVEPATPGLRQLLEHERALGLDALGARVAMVAELLSERPARRA
ncbi:MAG: GNAT family N-acetyltransferase [Renibacterium sp.]|nr:GNAT family N-acetyltransferase [Renibacterium sp.]